MKTTKMEQIPPAKAHRRNSFSIGDLGCWWELKVSQVSLVSLNYAYLNVNQLCAVPK